MFTQLTRYVSATGSSKYSYWDISKPGVGLTTRESRSLAISTLLDTFTSFFETPKGGGPSSKITRRIM